MGQPPAPSRSTGPERAREAASRDCINAIADPRHVAEVTFVPRAPNGAEEVPAMLSRLLEAHEVIVGKVRDAITATGAATSCRCGSSPSISSTHP
jgi:hypothetical protein